MPGGERTVWIYCDTRFLLHVFSAPTYNRESHLLSFMQEHKLLSLSCSHSFSFCLTHPLFSPLLCPPVLYSPLLSYTLVLSLSGSSFCLSHNHVDIVPQTGSFYSCPCKIQYAVQKHCLSLSACKCINSPYTVLSLCLQDSTTVTPVTLRVDPKGYFLYWTDQNKVGAGNFFSSRSTDRSRGYIKHVILSLKNDLSGGLRLFRLFLFENSNRHVIFEQMLIQYTFNNNNSIHHLSYLSYFILESGLMVILTNHESCYRNYRIFKM